MFLRSLSLGVVFALAVVVTPAVASTIVVDAANGPGTNFTDVAAAITAASPNDLLLVRPGVYAPFTVDTPLTILATSPNAATTTEIAVQNIALGERAALVGVRPDVLDVSNCLGVVLIQDMQTLRSITIAASRDVRLTKVRVDVGTTSVPVAAIDVTSARVEFSDVTAVGSTACTALACSGVDGGSGLVATNARMNFGGSSFRGGMGATTSVHPLPWAPGRGGHGMLTMGASSLRSAWSCFVAGEGGCQCTYPDCTYDAWTGIAFGVSGGPNVFSLHTNCGQPVSYVGVNCDELITANFAGPHTGPPSWDPALYLLTTPTAGSMLNFRVRCQSQPGTRAYFWMSRDDALVPGAPADLELLALQSRFLRLGPVTGANQIDFSILLPASIPKGTVYFCQAQIVPASGIPQRSNSVPIVVR